MGRSFANQAPNNESHPIHSTQELPGSALKVPSRTSLFSNRLPKSRRQPV
jgi:hypothetical protein